MIHTVSKITFPPPGNTQKSVDAMAEAIGTGSQTWIRGADGGAVIANG